MSGHSKWATTKHKKAVIDARRGKLFAKLIKNIEVAARQGGGDPAGNPTLYDAIQKAKKSSVPNDNIDRAVKRGSGAEAGGAAYEALTYEGYASGGVALYIECLTDNKNRAVMEVRTALTRNGGSMADSGSVAYRGLLPADALPGWPRDASQLWMGEGKHFLVFPVRHGEMVNYVGFVPTDEAGQLLIIYLGPPRTFPTSAASDIAPVLARHGRRDPTAEPSGNAFSAKARLMITTAAFGSPLANRIGALRFVTFWIATSVAAAGLHYVLHMTDQSPLVGASGAISGMMGAAARFGPYFLG